MKIVVLAGGISSERNVSLVTGTEVCRALRNKGHKAILVDMFLGLQHFTGSLDDIFETPDGLCSDITVSDKAPDLNALRAGRDDKSNNVFGKDVLEVCKMADIVFLGLHGSCGEDGRVQATFDLMGIPYTGADYISSAMAMDKAISKKLMEHAGVPTAPWSEHIYDESQIPALVEELNVPCVIKVVDGGSSLGMAMPDTKEELESALHDLLDHGNHIIVEKKLKGRELSIGVLGDEYLPAIEIIPNNSDFFDYAAKYQTNGSTEICPADITQEQWQAMGEDTLKLFKELGLSTYSRADFILDEEGNHWCLEINTLPGMTPTSLFPQEASAYGISYDDLCERIIELSLKSRN